MKQVVTNLVTFIQYIAVKGCSKIRCKKCLLNESCDRIPEHGKLVAQEWLRTSFEMNKKHTK